VLENRTQIAIEVLKIHETGEEEPNDRSR